MSTYSGTGINTPYTTGLPSPMRRHVFLYINYESMYWFSLFDFRCFWVIFSNILRIMYFLDLQGISWIYGWQWDFVLTYRGNDQWSKDSCHHLTDTLRIHSDYLHSPFKFIMFNCFCWQNERLKTAIDTGRSSLQRLRKRYCRCQHFLRGIHSFWW